jgi:uncharacterized membrane protein YjjP (DUF1212 family)
MLVLATWFACSAVFYLVEGRWWDAIPAAVLAVGDAMIFRYLGRLP